MFPLRGHYDAICSLTNRTQDLVLGVDIKGRSKDYVSITLLLHDWWSPLAMLHGLWHRRVVFLVLDRNHPLIYINSI